MGWVLKIQWLGRTWQWDEVQASITSRMELYSGALDRRSISVDLYFPESVNPAQSVVEGEDLDGAPAELSLDGEVYVSGYVERSVFGGAGAPVSLTVRERDYGDDQSWPPLGEIGIRSQQTERVTLGDYADFDELAIPDPMEPWVSTLSFSTETISVTSEGMMYPTVLGKPGGTDVPAYPVPFIDTTVASETLLLLGHSAGPANVARVWGPDNNGDLVETSVAVTPTVTTDDFGRTITIAYINGIGGAIDESETSGDWYASWAVAPLTETAADVVDLLGGASRRRIDWERMRSAYHELSGYQIDGVIDEQVDPWEWLEQNLFALLPGEIVSGPSGAYWVPWRPDSSPVATLVAGRRGVSLIDGGYLQYADTQPINSLQIAYARNEHAGGYSKRYNAAPSNNVWSAASAGRYGTRITELQTDIVYDDATAQRIALAWVRAHAQPALLIDLQLSRANWGHLQTGDIVEVTVSELGLSAERGQIAEITVDGSSITTATVALLREPV